MSTRSGREDTDEGTGVRTAAVTLSDAFGNGYAAAMQELAELVSEPARLLGHLAGFFGVEAEELVRESRTYLAREAED